MLAFVNVYKFLYKDEKFKTLPLLLFYVLTVVLTLMRIWSNLWFLGYILHQYLLEVLCPVLKINIGLNQCWMLLELSLRLRKSIAISKLTATHLSDESLSQSLEGTERKIFWGRLFVLVLIPVNVIGITVYLAMQGQTTDKQERNEMLNDWFSYTGYFFYLSFVLLLISVVQLIWLMRQMRDEVCFDS